MSGDDDGPGWDEHPEFKEILGFEAKDDGIFWVNKSEFFKYGIFTSTNPQLLTAF